MKPFYRDTWIEVDLDAIRANVESFRRHIPSGTGIMAVVKADGYGHGAVQVGEEALRSGADSLAVAMLDEAVVLRKAGITAPVLVLGYTPVESVEQASQLGIELTAYHTEWIEQAHEKLKHSGAQPVGIHIKTDTGMGRLGVRTSDELLSVVEALEKTPYLKWTGVFTHFACADEEDTTHTIEQHRSFQTLLSALRDAGKEIPRVHCCNTAAAMVFPEWGYDTIRLGIGLYGLYPSPYLKQRSAVSLLPALSLKTRITHVKTSPEAMTVSYGATYTASPGEQIATLPIGYADGFSRSLSNRGSVLHAGKRSPIVGRVCMDQIMVKIESDTAHVGDEVVLYGRQGEEEISLDEVAALVGTINYEIPCMLNYRIPRVYQREGKRTEVFHPLAMTHMPAESVNN
ncbi:alanine racemase [Brevibacillus ruminantium]|uniref:Alanine racemase n=1 Tax=Brevibacillus ruminantium TaxID=2950604 RepID=A0ABY4WGR1_9BACL|nr:alanine racemase [Brevibacillus ruminantium]USG66343.1 alanine racemase [Brevibacillus ruminantium]